MTKKDLKRAFSLIELSITILVIGILVAGVLSASNLVEKMRVRTARSLTESSDVNGIKSLVLWYEPTSDSSFMNAFGNKNIDDGDLIAALYDSSPQVGVKTNATQSTQSNMPQYKKGIINGLPALYFDGVDDYLSFSNILGYDLSIFTVIKTTDTDSSISRTAPNLQPLSSPILWSDINAANVRDMAPVMIYGGRFAYWYGTGTGTQNCYGWGSKIINDGSAHIINFQRSLNSEFSTYIDGSLDYYRSSAINPTCKNIANQNPKVFVGTNLVSKVYYKGYIAEIIAFEKILTAEERTSVNKYLSKKYAIKIS